LQKQLENGKNVIINVQTKDPKAKRLDYIFVGAGIRNGDGRPAPEWRVDQVKVGMTGRHPTLGCSLSDHFSVEATIALHQTTNGKPNNFPDIQELGHGSEERFDVKIGDNILETVPRLLASEDLPVSTYDEILAMIHTYTLRERRQRRLRLWHLVCSIFVSIGCFVAIWWSPHNYVSFILLFVSTFSFGAGIIDGMIGGLFVGSEIRALKEFEWEIKNAQRAAGGGANDEIELRDWYD
jgi:sphingomyelin phosphodiesterase 2